MYNFNISEIEKIINKLLHNTNTSLLNVQKSKVPHYEDLKLVKVNKYLYEGIDRKANNLMFRIDNLDYIIRDKTLVKYSGPIVNIFNRINPFIIFIDGLSIDPKNINVICDARNFYIEILTGSSVKYEYISKNILPNLITIPPINSRYTKVSVKTNTQSKVEINNTLVDINNVKRSIFSSIDSNTVNILSGNPSNIKIEFSYDGIYSAEYKSESIKTIIFPDKIELDYISNTNVINPYEFIFSNGMYYSNDDFINSNLALSGYGINFIPPYKVTKYSGLSLNKFITFPEDDINYKIFPDTTITFNNDIRTINSKLDDYGLNTFIVKKDSSYISYKYIENENASNTRRYFNIVNNIEKIKESIITNQLSNIISPLDYQFTHGMDKMDRVFYILERICEHNSYLLQEYIDNKSNIEVLGYSGIELKELCDFNGIEYKYSIDRYINHIDTQDVIVFKNGELYNNNISYDMNNINITFNTLEDTDSIEYMIFKNINNSNIEITINKNNNKHLISNYINFNNIILLTDDINDHIYKHIPKSEELQYDIPNSIKDLGRGYVEINIPEYHDNHKVFLSSRRKFIHKAYIISDNEYMINDLYKILLPDEFRYCSNINQFMIFHNKRKITNRDAFVCLNRWNLPFDKRFIHINKKCMPGDILDIYYVPDEVNEIHHSDLMSVNGYIEIDKSKLGYNFDSLNSSVFINGKRVPTKYVENISTDTIRVNHDINTIKNVSVIKHISYTDDIFSMISDIKNEWDNMVHGMSESELNTMFNFDIVISDIEADLRDNIYTTNMVLYEVLRRYWLINPKKVKVENPIFNIMDLNGQFVLPFNSSLTILDIIKLLRDNYITEDKTITTPDGSKVYPMNAEFDYSYDMLDLPSYQEYSQDGSVVIPSDSNKTSNDIDHIIDILSAQGVLIDRVDINAMTIDSLLEYILKNGDVLGLPMYSSIDASIIRPYFWRPEITMDSRMYNVYPIPIDSDLDQIIDLPGLYDKDTLIPLDSFSLKFKSSIIITVEKTINIKSSITTRIDNDLLFKGSFINRIDKNINIVSNISIPKYVNTINIKGSFINTKINTEMFKCKISIILSKTKKFKCLLNIKRDNTHYMICDLVIPRYEANILSKSTIITKLTKTLECKSEILIPINNSDKLFSFDIITLAHRAPRYLCGINVSTKTIQDNKKCELTSLPNTLALYAANISTVLSGEGVYHSTIDTPIYNNTINKSGSMNTNNNTFKIYISNINIPTVQKIYSYKSELVVVKDNEYLGYSNIDIQITKLTNKYLCNLTIII